MNVYRLDSDIKKRRIKKRKLIKKIHKYINNDTSSEENDSDYNSDDGSLTSDGFSFFSGDHVVCKYNKIYFRGKVSESSVDRLITILEEKNKEFLEYIKDSDLFETITPAPLYLHITSFGGCLFSGFRAVDAIKRSKIPIYTVIDGHAASAATLMSVVGVKRYMTPNSWALIHQLSASSGGTYWNIKDEYRNCTDMMNKIYSIYEEKTTMSVEKLKEILSHDRWWDVDKCIEMRLVDDVYV